VLRTVIVPLDGSDIAQRALPVADALAAAHQAAVVLVNTPATLEDDRLVPPAWLLDAARTLEAADVRTDIVDTKWAVEGIRAVVEEADDPIVCMATHGRGRVGAAILGSVAQDVVRTVHAPVVLVGPHTDVERHPGDGPLLVCHDGAPASSAVVPAAAAWMQAFGTGALLLHVSHPLDTEAAHEPATVIDVAAAQLAAHGHVSVETVRDSYPVGVILDMARDRRVPAIAMSTLGRSGLSRMTLGSVAASVVHAAPCPVLVCRPPEVGQST
jgi:nucleotide-binding universal stress UspA family protein